MRRRTTTLMAVVMLSALGMARPQREPEPQDLLRRALAAVGGEVALRDLRTMVLETHIGARNAGQEQDPFGLPNMNFQSTRQTMDRVGRRARADVELRGNVPNGLARVGNVVTGNAMMNINIQGRPVVGSRQGQQNGLNNLDLFMPMLLLRLTERPDSLAPAQPRTIAGEPADGLRYTLNGVTWTIWFSRRTGLPVQQESITDHNILGDVTTTMTWGNWTPTAVRLPGQVLTETGRNTTMILQRVVSQNEPVADSLFVIPDSIAQRFAALPPFTPGPTPPLPPVSLAEVAPGVWRATNAIAGQPLGNAYNALVVEQEDNLVLVEAPVSPAWTRSLLDTLAARFPGKRVSTVVNTHHHWDHAGGIRAVLAAGIPVITHERNVEFIRQVGTARKTVRPDALSRRGRLPAITGVADSLVVGRGTNRVVVYTAETTQDGGAHLVAYVPAPGVLFQSDMLAGPAGGQGTIPRAAAQDILRIAERCGIAVQKVVGGHGDVAAMEAITRAAQ